MLDYLSCVSSLPPLYYLFNGRVVIGRLVNLTWKAMRTLRSNPSGFCGDRLKSYGPPNFNRTYENDTRRELAPVRDPRDQARGHERVKDDKVQFYPPIESTRAIRITAQLVRYVELKFHPVDPQCPFFSIRYRLSVTRHPKFVQ